MIIKKNNCINRPQNNINRKSISWDMGLCSPAKVRQRFGKTYCLHFHGLRVSYGSNPEDENSTFLRNVCELLPDNMA